MNAKYIIGGIVFVAVSGFAYYAISPLFRNVTIDEAAPEPAERSSSVNGAESSVALATVVGTIGHPASGTARIIETDDGSYVRYENFETINGPDLYVYLAKDKDAREFVNLGLIKATQGNINYAVPDGIEVHDYRYVLVWCKAFGVLFNHADLHASQNTQ